MSCLQLNTILNQLPFFPSTFYYKVSLHRYLTQAKATQQKNCVNSLQQRGELYVFSSASVLFCPFSISAKKSIIASVFKYSLKKQQYHFHTVTLCSFASFQLPTKNESLSGKKMSHLFRRSSFTDIILFQRHCKNLGQHF